MIPLHKLEKLPRSHRLRKITKVFAEAERALSNGGILSADRLLLLAGIAAFVGQDPLFSPAALKALNEAAAVLRQTENVSAVQRAINTVRHILLTETGRSTADWDFIDSDGQLDPAQRRPFPGMMIYLEDIRSPFNVGAMFRTAESFGAEKIFLSPLCADPNHPRSQRSAMGCVDVLPWERMELAAVQSAPIFALETGGIPLAEFPFPSQGLLIAGSEELGVSPRALAVADASLGRVSIPCYGAKGSLNVSVAFGVVMQAWAQRLA